MVAVALIVLLLVLLLTVAIIAGGGQTLTVDLFGAELTTSGGGVYVIGLICGAIVAATLWLLRVGLRKSWKQHKRIRELERRADGAGRTDDAVVAEEQPSATTAEPRRSDADPT